MSSKGRAPCASMKTPPISCDTCTSSASDPSWLRDAAGEVVLQDVQPPPADLARHVGEPPLAPVTVAAGLADQQVQQRVPVRMAAPVHRDPVQLPMKLDAEPVHRIEDVLVP